MKIIHFTLGSVNPNSSNGINRVIEGLAKYGNITKDNEILVVTLKKNQKEKEILLERNGFDVLAFNSLLAVIAYFKKHADTTDIVHLHNAWSIQNIILSRVLIKKSIPYVITVHAGLMEDRVKGSNYFLKILFHSLLQKRHFDDAMALHAIAREEMTNISEYTSNQNIIYIPNGIDTKLKQLSKEQFHNKKINIGYLGRLSEEKNILGMINAVASLNIETLNKIELIIMGPKNNNYARQCISLVRSLNLDKHIIFTGKINSEEKWLRLSQLDIYIQASFSEGASLTVLEAMYSGLPLIITRTCNIAYLHGQDFLKMVEPLPKDIARGINEVVNDIEKFRKSGKKAHDFVCINFDWELIASDLSNMYKEVIDKEIL